MPADVNVVLQDAVTKTDSFNGTGVDIKNGGNSPVPMWAHVIVTSASNASGNATITFKVQHSANNSEWFDHTSGADQVITTSTTATPYNVYVPVLTDKRYVRLVATFSATTGTPTITYSAVLSLSKP